MCKYMFKNLVYYKNADYFRSLTMQNHPMDMDSTNTFDHQTYTKGNF